MVAQKSPKLFAGVRFSHEVPVLLTATTLEQLETIVAYAELPRLARKQGYQSFKYLVNKF